MAYKTTGYRGDALARSINTMSEVGIDLYAIETISDAYRGKIGYWHRPSSFSLDRWRTGRILGIKRMLDGDEHMPGVRRYMDRVPSPRGVIRFRKEIYGTGQSKDHPVMNTFEVWVSVPPLRGRLP